VINVRPFLVRNARYLILLAITLAIYFMFFSDIGKKPDKELKEDTGVISVREAEQKIQARAQDEEYWNTLLAEKPWLGYAISIGTVLFFCLLSYGLFLDVVWSISLFRKRNIIPKKAGISPSTPFSLGDIFRVSVLILSISMVIGVAVNLTDYVIGDFINDNFIILLHTALTDIMVVFCVMYMAKTVYGTDLRALGLYTKGIWDDIRLGLATYAAVLPIFLLLLAALMALAYWLHYEPPPHPLIEVLVEEENHPLFIVFSTILACVIGPIVEEIFFRGFCYPILKKRWGTWMAMIVSSAVFAVVHNSGFAFVPVFSLGMALAYVYDRRGSLVSSCALHITHNSLFLAYFFLMRNLFLAD